MYSLLGYFLLAEMPGIEYLTELRIEEEEEDDDDDDVSSILC